MMITTVWPLLLALILALGCSAAAVGASSSAVDGVYYSSSRAQLVRMIGVVTTSIPYRFIVVTVFFALQVSASHVPPFIDRYPAEGVMG